MANLQLDNDEILRAIGMVACISRDPADWDTTELDDARAVIRAGLRKFFHPEPVEGSIHQWRFLERQFVAVGEASYDTGTIAISDGVVTLSDGTFPSWADDGVLRVGGQSLYIDSRDSDTQVTLESTSGSLDEDAETDYELHRWRYALPSDYGDMVSRGAVLSKGDSDSRRLGISDEAEIRLRYSINFKTGDPCKFAIFHGDDDDSANWYLSVWPTMEEEAFLTITYRAVPEDNLGADLSQADSTVQIDAVHAETVLAAVQSSAEEYYNDNPNSVHHRRYLSRLVASIEHDKHSQGAVEFDDNSRVNQRRKALLDHLPVYNDLL